MIISHSHKFIFIKTAKVGGTSLEIALSKYCDTKSVITTIESDDEAYRKRLGYPGPRNFKKRFWELTPEDIGKAVLRDVPPRRYYNHIPAEDIRERVGEEIWNEYTKISVVRNPWTRALSKFHWDRHWERKRPRDRLKPNFFKYLLDNPHQVAANWSIYTICNEIAVDHIIRYERFHDDLQRVAEAIGIEDDLYSAMRTIRAKSGVRQRLEPLRDTPEQKKMAKDLIGLLGKREIDCFGYVAPPDFLDYT